MELVVNSWLPERMRPNATEEELESVKQFLAAFLQNDDKMFVRRPGQFLDKIYACSKTYDYDELARERFKFFIVKVINNSEKCVFVDDENLQELPASTSEMLNAENTNFYKDIFLFEAANATTDKTIITTDIKLQKQMADDEHFQVVLLEDFLNDYG